MQKSYQGLRKPFAVAVYAPSDSEQALPILEELSGRGLSLCYGKPIRKRLLDYACGVIVFLTPRSVENEAVTDAILQCQAKDRPLITVQLEPVVLPETLRRVLYTRHIIDASHAPDSKALADRILTAEALKQPELSAAQKTAAKRVAVGLFAGAVAVVVLAATLLLRQLLSSRQTEDTMTEGTAGVQLVLPEGITEEDLLSIQSLVLLGDQIIAINNRTTLTDEPEEVQNPYDLVDEVNDENGNRSWFYLGKQSQRGTVTDLSLIGKMSNLRSLHLFNQGEIDLTPLGNLTMLDSLELDDCRIRDISPLSALIKLQHLGLKDNRVTDLSPLAACKRLQSVYMGFLDIQSLNGLGPNVNTLELWAVEQLRDISALGSCTKLTTLRIQNAKQLTDISPLSQISSLREVCFDDCTQIKDFSALGFSKGIRRLEIQDAPTNDLSFLSAFTGVEELSIHETQLDNLDFLTEVTPVSGGLSLSCNERIRDYSGLAAQKNYSRLVLYMDNPSYSVAVQPYLTEASVKELSLNRCTDLTLSALPAGVKQLELDNVLITDLSGVEENENLETLVLRNMNRLTSLSGIESIRNPLYLIIENCVRLTDPQSLYTNELIRGLEIRNDGFVPDFSRLSFSQNGAALELDNAYGITDLTCLAELPPAQVAKLTELHIRNMEQLTDLRPVMCLTALTSLTVPYQLEEQVEEVTADNERITVNIAYPSGEWEQDNSELILLSLDELNTLPNATLARMTSACIVGDQVVDTDTMQYNTDWSEKGPTYYLEVRDGNGQAENDPAQRVYVGQGSVDNLNLLAKLPNLRWLSLISQPLSSLDGIQSFGNLEGLSVDDCPISDASSVFALTGLKQLSLQRTGITSIQGIQNLTGLRRINIKDTQVSDLSPLSECDFSSAMEEGGLELHISGLPCEDFSALSSVEAFQLLEISDLPATTWLPLIAGKPLEFLIAFNVGFTNEDIKTLSAFPGIKELHISWNLETTDLTPLLDAPDLEYVKISRTMEQAVASLEGKDYRFQLDIEG